MVFLEARWSKSEKNYGQKIYSNRLEQRAKAAACLLNGNLYILGGRSSKHVSRDFWRLKKENRKWEKVNVSDVPLVEGHAMAAVENTVYVFGGQYSRRGCPLWKWKEKLDKFLLVNTLSGGYPSTRRGHSMVIYGNSLFVFGGYIDLHGSTNELWRYDCSNQTWRILDSSPNSSPISRHSHSAIAFNGAMWIYGGINNLTVCSDFWRFNFCSLSWDQIRTRSSPGAIFGHSSCIGDANMFIFGGERTDGSLSNDLWCFNFNSHCWSQIETSTGSIPAGVVHSCFVSLHPDPTGAKSSKRREFRETPEYQFFTDLEANEGRCSHCSEAMDRNSSEDIGVNKKDREKRKMYRKKKKRQKRRSSFDSNIVVSRNSTQSSADSGFMEWKFKSSQDRLLSKKNRPKSIDSNLFGANHGYESSDQELDTFEDISPSSSPETTLSIAQNSENLVMDPLCNLADLSRVDNAMDLPGFIRSVSEEGSKFASATRFVNVTKSRTGRFGRRSNGEHIELNEYGGTKRQFVNKWLGPNEELTEIALPNLAAGHFEEQDCLKSQDVVVNLCPHNDGNCVSLVLLGGRGEHSEPPGCAGGLTVWVCCIRKK